MTKASPTRAAKKVAAKKDPRAAAKEAVAKRQAEKAADQPAPDLTGQELVQLLQILENAPTGNRAQRQILAGIENKLVAMAVAKGALQVPEQAPQ